VSHHLVGVAEMAEMLGVSRQRVNQLASSYADFPEPEAELAAGRIWTRDDIESWLARHPERKPGQQEGGFVNFERFTDRARNAIVLAQTESNEWGHNYLGCEHLILGLQREIDGIGGRVLTAMRITQEDTRGVLKKIVGRGPMPVKMHVPFTPRAKRALELALECALELGHNYIGTEHLLLGVLREGDNLGCRMLIELGLDLAAVRLKVLEILGFPQPEIAQVATEEVRTELLRMLTERLDRIDQRLAGLEDRLAAGQ
jgi:ATP-dependent Clp protease ATP-binding subunit ClpC